MSGTVMDLLSKWDAKNSPLAPLTDKQKETMIHLSGTFERPLPTKFVSCGDDDREDSSAKLSLTKDERPPYEECAGYTGDEAALNLGQEKIENAQQFFTWFLEVQSKMEEDQELKYRHYREEVESYASNCHQMMSNIDTSLQSLEKLKTNYFAVAAQTDALHNACEDSLADQANLVGQADDISERLVYFHSLESLRHKLNRPGFSVTGESFVPMLSKIDDCISYMNDNPQYKESSVYLLRLKQCLNQALALVKHYVMQIFRTSAVQASNAYQKEKDDPSAASESSFTILYGKYKAQAFRVKNIMEQIERRLVASNEYGTLLSDCQQSYLDYRSRLLSPIVSDTVIKLCQQHSRNPCTLFRSGCSYLVSVCLDEHHLYFDFFSQHCQGLDNLLESFCNILYEMFRPLVIHMVHMESLAELCNILKVEMLEERVQRKGDQLSSFECIIAQMLEDVQERLVYRAQAYIRTDIECYNPAGGDLAYPDKLMVDLSDTATMKSQEGNKVSVADLQAMWYPTVRRTLVCLSKLYTCISRSAFEGLAQEALSVCISTLKFASGEISKRKGAINGNLFLIKHLLILREQIAPFDVDFAVKEVALDFSRMKMAAVGLLKSGSKMLKFNNKAFLEVLLEGVPQLTEYTLDSKKEVDNELKTVCEHFISDVVASFIGPITVFLEQTSTIQLLATENGKELKSLLMQQPFAKPDAIRKTVSEAYMLLKSKLPTTIQSMTLYLANKDTEYILFKPVKAKVLSAYGQLFKLIAENYSEEDQQIVGCPSQQQVSSIPSDDDFLSIEDKLKQEHIKL